MRKSPRQDVKFSGSMTDTIASVKPLSDPLCLAGFAGSIPHRHSPGFMGRGKARKVNWEARARVLAFHIHASDDVYAFLLIIAFLIPRMITSWY